MTGNGLPPRYYYAMQGDEAYSIEGTEQFIKVYVDRPDKNGKFPNSAASRENAHDHPLNSAIAFFPRGLRDPEWHSIVDNCAVLTLGGIPSIWPLGAREPTPLLSISLPPMQPPQMSIPQSFVPQYPTSRNTINDYSADVSAANGGTLVSDFPNSQIARDHVTIAPSSWGAFHRTSAAEHYDPNGQPVDGDQRSRPSPTMCSQPFPPEYPPLVITNYYPQLAYLNSIDAQQTSAKPHSGYGDTSVGNYNPTPSTNHQTLQCTHGRLASGHPSYGQPAYGQPAFGQPTYGQTIYDEPAEAYANYVESKEQDKNQTIKEESCDYAEEPQPSKAASSRWRQWTQ